jgi:hypothetical protein
VANFHGPQANEATETRARALIELLNQMREKAGLVTPENGGTEPEGTGAGLGTAQAAEGTTPAPRGSGAGAGELGEATSTEGTEPLLDYLLGQGR